jgi:drug/metabolite transporter (DMT)-like permease
MRTPSNVSICIGVAAASGIWGLYWIPQRELESAGLTGGWGTLAQYILPLLLMAPIALWRWSRGNETGALWWLLGTLTGGGIVCYANSFLLTEVVRALLLFYLTPVWATLIDRFVLKRPIPRQRYLSLGLAVAGVWIVFGQSSGVPLPANAGDWLALAGGAMIAAGAARINATQPKSIFPILFSFYVYGAAVALVLTWLLAEQLGPMPAAADLWSMLPFLLLLVVVLLMPTNAFLIWSPTRIGAGVFGILILSEIVFGSISAALWADETFGWREIAGCTLIVMAGLTEVLASWASEPESAT